MKTFKQISIGFPILIILMLITIGDIGTVFSILVGSIICTLGIGGLFWLFISAFVGWLVEAIFLKATHSASQSPKSVAILSYIQKARYNGLSENQIRTKLQNAGWPKDKIENNLHN